jgi:hypothetical protein
MEGPRLENDYIFYDHLIYFTEIWDILRPSGTFCVHLVHFSGFGIMHHENLATLTVGVKMASEIELFLFED